MNIELKVNEIDEKALFKLPVIKSLSEQLNKHFLKKSYGNSIDNFILICVLIKTKLGYEEWYKERRPEYIEYKLYKNKLTGQELEIKKRYTIEFKLDNEVYDKFIISSENDSSKIIASKILEIFSSLDKLPKKANNFNKDLFKTDLEEFFRKRKLL